MLNGEDRVLEIAENGDVKGLVCPLHPEIPCNKNCTWFRASKHKGPASSGSEVEVEYVMVTCQDKTFIGTIHMKVVGKVDYKNLGYQGT